MHSRSYSTHYQFFNTSDNWYEQADISMYIYIYINVSILKAVYSLQSHPVTDVELVL